MVAIVMCGRSIRGILNYNENKVNERKAVFIGAVGFGMEPKELTFRNKLNRFKRLTEKYKKAGVNALHITLNFDPSEKGFSKRKLNKIAESYMQRIGFGDQPYLVYKHTDAGHPHIHIVTTNIPEYGKRIETHLIGKLKSNPARIEVEKEFGLVPADGKKLKEMYILKPIDLEKAVYGKSETKSEISKIVRSVFKYYKYTSFEELNAALGTLGVYADRGTPGTKKYEQGGLTYSLLSEENEKIGVAIKASSIYDNPILKEIEKKYDANYYDRKRYKGRLISNIEEALEAGVNKVEFEEKLKLEGIDVLFAENIDGYIYGVTFVDHKTGCIFKGSDISKDHSANAILPRLLNGTKPEIAELRSFVEGILSKTTFSGEISKVISQWAGEGLQVQALRGDDDVIRYRFGRINDNSLLLIPADKRMTAYFKANLITPENLVAINNIVKERTDSHTSHESGFIEQTNLSSLAQQYLDEIFLEITKVTYVGGGHVPYALLQEANKRKRKKRR